jgi:REP element-mobilizing transposase RayT
MPMPRQPYLTGHYYHIYNRGAHRFPIFREPENYRFVQGKLRRYSQEFALTLISYCLMPNHYHFLVRQDGEHRAGLLPQRVFNSYSKAYNKRYDHCGTLFEGSYRVRHVRLLPDLLHMCRYIHGNPPKARLVRDAADWPFSNYLEWIGERDDILVDREFIASHFSSPQAYRRFLLAYLERPRTRFPRHQPGCAV